VAVATHLDLLGRFEAVDSATTISGILLVESRHCTVLADAGGRGDDLDAMLSNDAEPIVPQELS
jgi:F0F1-type ATP synthase epsilon subunit